jgi:hypothetical protein
MDSQYELSRTTSLAFLARGPFVKFPFFPTNQQITFVTAYLKDLKIHIFCSKLCLPALPSQYLSVQLIAY